MYRAASPEVTLDLRETELEFEPRSLTLISGCPGSGGTVTRNWVPHPKRGLSV